MRRQVVNQGVLEQVQGCALRLCAKVKIKGSKSTRRYWIHYIIGQFSVL